MTDLPSVPRTGSELESLIGFLDDQRAVTPARSRAQLTRSVEPSTLTLGGIIQHLTEVERWWFRDVFLAEPALDYRWSDQDPNGDFRIDPGAAAEQLVEAYQGEIEH